VDTGHRVAERGSGSVDPAAEPADGAPVTAGGTGVRRTLMAVIAVAVVALAGTVGWVIGDRSSGSSTPAASAVDIGFAQDMATHHIQAVTMAGYERDYTSDSGLKVLAFDIESSQEFQVGQIQGWLDQWGQTRNNPHPMAWMGDQHMTMGPGGLMPGMATPAQMNKLESLHGKALDILFLQLMIHHHQGGLPMARYAVAHATEPFVRTMAGQIVSSQSSEIILMEQTLRKLGGTPLPEPAS
jgi:uncharacterized protein (DUF305 family)